MVCVAAPAEERRRFGSISMGVVDGLTMGCTCVAFGQSCEFILSHSDVVINDCLFTFVSVTFEFACKKAACSLAFELAGDGLGRKFLTFLCLGSANRLGFGPESWFWFRFVVLDGWVGRKSR